MNNSLQHIAEQNIKALTGKPVQQIRREAEKAARENLKELRG